MCEAAAAASPSEASPAHAALSSPSEPQAAERRVPAGEQERREPGGEETTRALLRKAFPTLPNGAILALHRLMLRRDDPWPIQDVLDLAQQHWREHGSLQHGLAPKRIEVKAEKGGMARDLVRAFIKAALRIQQVSLFLPARTRAKTPHSGENVDDARASPPPPTQTRVQFACATANSSSS